MRCANSGAALPTSSSGLSEVPNQVTKTTAAQGGGAGVTYGVGKGFVRWIGRELTGAYDIVTFPIPFPRGYKPS